MSSKFFYLYLVGGFIAIALLVCDVIRSYPKMIATTDILLDGLPAIVLFYLAFKVRREKEDKEMM